MHHQKAEPHHSGTLLADGNSLTVEDVMDVARHSRRVELSTDAAEKVAGCRSWVDHGVEEGKLTVKKHCLKSLMLIMTVS